MELWKQNGADEIVIWIASWICEAQAWRVGWVGDGALGRKNQPLGEDFCRNYCNHLIGLGLTAISNPQQGKLPNCLLKRFCGFSAFFFSTLWLFCISWLSFLSLLQPVSTSLSKHIWLQLPCLITNIFLSIQRPALSTLLAFIICLICLQNKGLLRSPWHRQVKHNDNEPHPKSACANRKFYLCLLNSQGLATFFPSRDFLCLEAVGVMLEEASSP